MSALRTFCSDARFSMALLVCFVKLFFIDVDMNGKMGFYTNDCLRFDEENVKSVNEG
jgi:hypothetical protein